MGSGGRALRLRQAGPRAAGNALITLFAGDLYVVVAGIGARGVELALRETYSNGVPKATFRHADGNEIGFGGMPK